MNGVSKIMRQGKEGIKKVTTEVIVLNNNAVSRKNIKVRNYNTSAKQRNIRGKL